MEEFAMGNFMRAYTIAFESSNGEQVTSRAIVPFFKKIEEILKETPENVIRRINGKVMRVHAYEWSDMNEEYLVVPIGKLKEKDKPFGSDPETQKLIDIPQEMFDVNSIAFHKRYRVAIWILTLCWIDGIVYSAYLCFICEVCNTYNDDYKTKY